MGTGVIAGDSGTCTWTPPGLAASGAAAGAGASAAGGSSAAIASLRGDSIVTPAARTRHRVTLKFVRRGQARGERFMMDRPTPLKGCRAPRNGAGTSFPPPLEPAED